MGMVYSIVVPYRDMEMRFSLLELLVAIPNSISYYLATTPLPGGHQELQTLHGLWVFFLFGA